MTYNVFSGTLNPAHFTSLHACRDAKSTIATGRRRRRVGHWSSCGHQQRDGTYGARGSSTIHVIATSEAAATATAAVEALVTEPRRRRRHPGPRVARPAATDAAAHTVVPRIAVRVESGSLRALQSLGRTQRSVYSIETC